MLWDVAHTSLHALCIDHVLQSLTSRQVLSWVLPFLCMAIKVTGLMGDQCSQARMSS